MKTVTKDMTDEEFSKLLTSHQRNEFRRIRKNRRGEPFKIDVDEKGHVVVRSTRDGACWRFRRNKHEAPNLYAWVWGGIVMTLFTLVVGGTWSVTPTVTHMMFGFPLLGFIVGFMHEWPRTDGKIHKLGTASTGFLLFMGVQEMRDWHDHDQRRHADADVDDDEGSL
jgi:hypothetical protein